MKHYYANRYPDSRGDQSRTPRKSSSYLPSMQPQYSAAYEAPVSPQYNYPPRPVHFNIPYGAQPATTQYKANTPVAVDPYNSQQTHPYAGSPSRQSYTTSYQQPQQVQASLAPQAVSMLSSPSTPVSQMNCIIEFTGVEGGLYLGGYEAATNQPLLDQYNIKAVLTIISENRVQYTSDQIYLHKFVRADDDPRFDLSEHFEQCLEFIENARKNRYNVLVHCMAGISRSATIILAYLMKTYKYKFNDALQYVRARRPIVNPNDGFVLQLRNMESKMGSKTEVVNESPEKKSSIFSFFDWF